MVRLISLMAMAGGFLAISPHLRDTVLTGYSNAGIAMDTYSPYSYIGLGAAVLGGLVLFLYKSSQPR